MKDLIKLKSRGYEENYLKKLKKPMIVVGAYLEEAEAVVKSI